MYPRRFLCEEAKIKQRTPSKEEPYKIGEEAIWESRFTCFFFKTPDGRMADHPRENKIYIRHIQLLAWKYILRAFVKYISNILWRIYHDFINKIYAKYILIIQPFAKIYFIYFDICVTYIFFHEGKIQRLSLFGWISVLGVWWGQRLRI